MSLKDNILIDRPQIYNIRNSTGLNFSIFENGSIKSIEQGSVQINLIPGSSLEPGCSNLYLRKRGDKFIAVPLLGPKGPGNHVVNENIYEVKGKFGGILFSCRLLLAKKDDSWLWDVQIVNASGKRQEFDLLYVQDVGLACADGNEKNEFYISQYVDYTPLWHREHGHVVCCRQNEHGPDGFPWLALGSISKTNSFSTDGMQFFGPVYKETGVAHCLSVSELPGLCQQELAVVALQEKPFILEPGQSRNLGFFGIFCEDHVTPTASDDLEMIDSRLKQLKKLSDRPWSDKYVYEEPTRSLFSESSLFPSEDLTEDELDSLFGVNRRHSEFFEGELLSFFYSENQHVVLRGKELRVERPHGHIMKTGTSLTPNDINMSFSAYMFGVFQSHVAQGNVNFNRFLTLNTNSLNIPRHTGQRIFVRQNGEYYQLGIPSAFEMSLNGCRWIYKQGDLMFEVLSWAAPDRPEIILKLRVLQGRQPEWLISNQLASEQDWSLEHDSQNNGDKLIKFVPGKKSELARMFPGGFFSVRLENSEVIKQTGGDELLFADGKSRGLHFLLIELTATKEFVMRICGRLVSQTESRGGGTNSSEAEVYSRDADRAIAAWKQMSSNLNMELPSNLKTSGINDIIEILPWFAHNAQIHYLAPYGLEQYGGAAWGTRDICQGPVEMLLALEHYREVRKILSIVFSNQNIDGNWPQWWMFDRYGNIRAAESHGDIVFWPILAVSEYIRSSGDYHFLDEELPFYHEDGPKRAEHASVIDHILRAIENVKNSRFAGGTVLANYSGGDWNDSMQPANQELKKRLISSWTVILSYQAFRSFAEVCRKAGRIKTADELEKLCDAIQGDFNRFLIKDGVVAGFGLVNQKGGIDLLVHPSDSTIGIHYSLLPMTRGIISGIFTPEQAKLHSEIIEQRLKGPDGARLMDNSPEYNGGLQRYFKRAESCPYFGREIGLMYTHAHLRYAEAMARLGHAEAFVKALRQVVPVGIQEIIPQADIRQSNCYYSSSDADFSSRSDASERYDDLIAGKVAVKGGWRVYSSGPGMFVSFIIRYLLGLRRSYGRTIFDPVMPGRFDGLAADMNFCGKDVKFVYRISQKQNGVSRIEINGKQCGFDREDNPYRTGGAAVADSALTQMLDRNLNVIKIYT
jgi:cellobiose phosphorylase